MFSAFFSAASTSELPLRPSTDSVRPRTQPLPTRNDPVAPGTQSLRARNDLVSACTDSVARRNASMSLRNDRVRARAWPVSHRNGPVRPATQPAPGTMANNKSKRRKRRFGKINRNPLVASVAFSSENLRPGAVECADLSALWNWETCLPVGKRRRVAALQIPKKPA
jgi:hypothetical protein